MRGCRRCRHERLEGGRRRRAHRTRGMRGSTGREHGSIMTAARFPISSVDTPTCFSRVRPRGGSVSPCFSFACSPRRLGPGKQAEGSDDCRERCRRGRLGVNLPRVEMPTFVKPTRCFGRSTDRQDRSSPWAVSWTWAPSACGMSPWGASTNGLPWRDCGQWRLFERI